MCIIKTESWAFVGKSYPTEREAVRAGLTDIGQRIIKDGSGRPLDAVLDSSDELISLLTRHRDIFDEMGEPDKPGHPHGW